MESKIKKIGVNGDHLLVNLHENNKPAVGLVEKDEVFFLI